MRSSSKRAAAALGLSLLAGCVSLDAPERQARVTSLLAEAAVPVVVEPAATLAFVTVGDALTFSPGYERGEALRARVGLPSPTLGFAQAFVAALRAQPRFASTAFAVLEPDAAREVLAARGDAPVFFASTGTWRLYYDLSLHRYTLSVWLQLHVVPAAQVAAGRGRLATPERLWGASCTFRGPATPQALEAWEAEDGALLQRMLREAQQACGARAAARLAAFLDRGEEQGAFDFGDIEAAPEGR